MKFEIDYFLLSDFATQGLDGKFVLGGIYSSEISFPAAPAEWPPFYITICLRSLECEFDFQVELDSSDGTVLFILSGDYRADVITEASRIVLQTQIPPQPFTGSGVYRLIAHDRSETTRSEKNLFVRVGETSAQPPVMTALMRAGPISKKESDKPLKVKGRRPR